MSEARSRRMHRFVNESPLTWEYVRERLGEPSESDDCPDCGIGHSEIWRRKWHELHLHRGCVPDDLTDLHPGRVSGAAFFTLGGKFQRCMEVYTVSDLQCALHLMRWDDE